MSFSQIEAELENLTPEELLRLAVKSWGAFVQKEGIDGGNLECSEEDPALLAALDEAIRQADAHPGESRTAMEVLARIRQWTTK